MRIACLRFKNFKGFAWRQKIGEGKTSPALDPALRLTTILPRFDRTALDTLRSCVESARSLAAKICKD